ncbi:unnamed protein product [Calypogeia fissa]
MADCKTAPTPLSEGLVLLSDTNAALIDGTTYRHLVDKLNYLTNTCLDISFAVSLVSRSPLIPKKHTWMQSSIFSDIYVVTMTGIFYAKNSPTTLAGYTGSSGPWEVTGFTDADWAACKETQRSVGAYFFTMANGPVTWSSKQQATVSRITSFSITGRTSSLQSS